MVFQYQWRLLKKREKLMTCKESFLTNLFHIIWFHVSKSMRILTVNSYLFSHLLKWSYGISFHILQPKKSNALKRSVLLKKYRSCPLLAECFFFCFSLWIKQETLLSFALFFSTKIQHLIFIRVSVTPDHWKISKKMWIRPPVMFLERLKVILDR